MLISELKREVSSGCGGNPVWTGSKRGGIDLNLGGIRQGSVDYTCAHGYHCDVLFPQVHLWIIHNVTYVGNIVDMDPSCSLYSAGHSRYSTSLSKCGKGLLSRSQTSEFITSLCAQRYRSRWPASFTWKLIHPSRGLAHE